MVMAWVAAFVISAACLCVNVGVYLKDPNPFAIASGIFCGILAWFNLVMVLVAL